MFNDKGSLKETSAIKLMLSVFEQDLTGILYFKKEEIRKVLYLSKGKLIWATSNSDEDRLENILMSEGTVDPITMGGIKKEVDAAESIGKILVEKGVITLEDLIGSTKTQLKGIILSVLKWDKGEFEFVEDTPPERLISLDLSISDFIIDFILKDMELDYINKEMASLTGLWVKVTDAEKISKYNLSDTQKELLVNFDGKKKLEEIKAEFADAHGESLLKIIYFFFISELIEKRENEVPDLDVLEEEIEKKPEAPPEEEDDLDLDRIAQESKKDEFYIFEPDRTKDQFVDDTSTRDFLSSREAPVEEKKKTKQFYLLLIFVMLILIIGGVILFLLPENSNKESITKGDSKRDIIAVDEKQPEVQKDDKKIEIQMKKEDKNEITEKTPVVKDDKNKENVVKKEKNLPVKTTENKNKTAPIQKKPPVKPKTVKKIEKKKAIDHLKKGDLVSAGKTWRDEMIKQNIKFSILLELDCMKESVMNAYNIIELKEDFFILNKKREGRICFLVLWGKFFSKQDATEGLKSIPDYFLKQQSPPRVIELSKYL